MSAVSMHKKTKTKRPELLLCLYISAGRQPSAMFGPLLAAGQYHSSHKLSDDLSCSVQEDLFELITAVSGVILPSGGLCSLKEPGEKDYLKILKRWCEGSTLTGS